MTDTDRFFGGLWDLFSTGDAPPLTETRKVATFDVAESDFGVVVGTEEVKVDRIRLLLRTRHGRPPSLVVEFCRDDAEPPIPSPHE